MACRGSKATPAQPASAIFLPVDKSAQVGADAQKTHPDLDVEEVDIIVACNAVQGNGQMVCEAMEKSMNSNITVAQNANAPLQKSAPHESREDTSTTADDFSTDGSLEIAFERQTNLDSAPVSTRQKISGRVYVPPSEASTTADDFPTDDSQETAFVRQTTLDSAPKSTKLNISGCGYVPPSEASTTADDFPTDDSQEIPFVRQTTLFYAPESTKQKFSGKGYVPPSEASTTADDFPTDDSQETPFVRQTTLFYAPESTKQKFSGSGCLHYSEAKFGDGLRLKGPTQAARGMTFNMEMMEEQVLPDDDIVEPARKPYGWMCCSGPKTRK